MGIASELTSLKKTLPRFVFLDYERLKAAVESKDADAVVRLMRLELDKVSDFAAVQWEVISAELKKQMRKDVPENLGSLENLAEAVVHLHAYVGLTYEAFVSIVRQCAEQQETASCAWLAARVESAAFRSCSFDAALAQLGQLYAAWRRQHGQGAAVRLGGMCGGLAQTFFVPKEKTMLTKVALLKLLRPATRIAGIPTTSTTRSSNNFSLSVQQKVTHVYFESPGGEQYAERLRRSLATVQGVQEPCSTVLLQCMWEGDKGTNPKVRVILEDSQASTTESLLSHRDMPALLEGTLDPAAVAVEGGGDNQQQRATLRSVLSAVRDGGLRPSVSVSLLRSSFAVDDAGSSAEMVAMDESLRFRDEGSSSSGWSTVASATSTGRQFGFPGAVLYLRLPAGPAGELLDSLGELDLQPVPGFSDALHAAALLRHASPRPPWLPGATPPEQTPRPGGHTEEAKTASLAAPMPAMQLPKKPAATATKDPDKGPAAKEAVDEKLFVDLKTPLASERTVIRWFRSAVLLSSVSGLLVTRQDTPAVLNSMLLGLASLLFMVLPLRQFWQRSMNFMRPEAVQPKTDRMLPTALAWVLVTILVATLLVEGVFTYIAKVAV